MKCITDKMSVKCLAFIIFLNTFHSSLASLSTTTPTIPSTNGSHEPVCSTVKDLLIQRGIAEKDLPKAPIKDAKLRYCDVPSSSSSCCSSAVEQRLSYNAKTAMEKVTRDSISKMSSTLQTRAQKFNELFKALLQQSKEGFHQMFKQTYGVIYEQNSYVFNDLFTMLEGYFMRGKLDLTETMDKFFNQLYQKMFTVINRQYDFNDEYLACVSEYMKELKPFGDVPDKLSVQVKRSFVATRTFVQALTSAAEIARSMMNLRPVNDCTAALTRMSSCGACMGYSEKPCELFCVSVMKQCLHQYSELGAEWDNFVVQMEKVSDRLLGPFNIVMVVEPINIKISEAIMNFQESGGDISKRIYQGCGAPKLQGRQRRAAPLLNTNADLFIEDEEEFEARERVRRAADPGNQENRSSRNQEINVKPINFARNDYQGNRGGGSSSSSSSSNGNHRGRNGNSNRNNQRGGGGGGGSGGNYMNGKSDSRESALDKLVKEIRQKVKDTKTFWTNLPYAACNNEDFAPAGNNDNCWNGQSINRFVPSNKATEAPANTRQSQIVAQQLFTLKTTINHLKNAYNGNDVEWPDSDDDGSDETEAESGSGSGSGIDDDDEGSGIPHYPDHPEQPITPPYSPIDTSSSETGISRNSLDEHDRSSEVDQDITSKESEGAGEEVSHKSSATTTTWKTKRLLLTYFLPLVMAWFGGSISSAISELL